MVKAMPDNCPEVFLIPRDDVLISVRRLASDRVYIMKLLGLLAWNFGLMFPWFTDQISVRSDSWLGHQGANPLKHKKWYYS
jgi:hypothetical protein